MKAFQLRLGVCGYSGQGRHRDDTNFCPYLHGHICTI